MKYVDEYRAEDAAKRLAEAIDQRVTRPWTLMEVCGGQTHAIARFGIEALLPEGLTLLHGPGCPVCVTPASVLDQAIVLGRRSGVILCTYGDMLRVPGSASDLRAVRAEGGDVRVVYSALDALALARANPSKNVVFLAIGFETTAPAHALAVLQAQKVGAQNFFLLVAHARVPPALEMILQEPEPRVNAFLAAGHVCAIEGTAAYAPIASKYRVPIVVTGFEPVDILAGVLAAVEQLEAGRAEVENAYRRVARDDGNGAARRAVEQVFEVASTPWRGMGVLADGGLVLRAEFAAFDAAKHFDLAATETTSEGPAAGECLSGLVLVGRIKPTACPAFGTRCTPDFPLGATMVSSEGACAAYFRFRSAP